MKNKKKILVILIIVIIVLAIMSFIVVINKNRNTNNENWENPYVEPNKEEINYQENITTEGIKKENGYKANTDLYQVDTEYDGRKVLNVKANIQFKVAFAGIIKTKLQQINEVDEIFNNNYPQKNGIWVENESKEKILNLIKTNTNSNYKIDENGYLVIENKNQQNENDKILEKAINSNKINILAMNSFYYEVDNATGNITEYPFEKLDAYQSYEKIVNDEDSIIIITTNSKNKLNNNEILEGIMQALK